MNNKEEIIQDLVNSCMQCKKDNSTLHNMCKESSQECYANTLVKLGYKKQSKQINLFSFKEYKVTLLCEYSVDSPDYDDYITEDFTENFECSGLELLEIIYKKINDRDFFELRFIGNEIFISYLQDNGKAVDYTLIYEEIEGD